MVQRYPRILAILTTGCVLLLVIGLVGWFGASAAGAASGSIALSPTSGLPASSVSVSGTGFADSEKDWPFLRKCLAVLSGLGGPFECVFTEKFGRAWRKYGKVWSNGAEVFSYISSPIVG